VHKLAIQQLQISTSLKGCVSAGASRVLKGVAAASIDGDMRVAAMSPAKSHNDICAHMRVMAASVPSHVAMIKFNWPVWHAVQAKLTSASANRSAEPGT